MVTLQKLKDLSPTSFKKYIVKLLPKLGYSRVESIGRVSDEDYHLEYYDLEAYKDGVKFLFICKYMGGINLEFFADTCRRKRADKGIVITRSPVVNDIEHLWDDNKAKVEYFFQNGKKNLEIEFWGGKELLNQIKGKFPLLQLWKKKNLKT